ncbi:hypothetical protein SRHO_G00266120 [Serrasalmus rhombeus]
MPSLSVLPSCALARVRVGRLERGPRISPCGFVLPCPFVARRTPCADVSALLWTGLDILGGKAGIRCGFVV